MVSTGNQQQKGKPMTISNKITVKFDTNRKLTLDELKGLLDAIAAQVSDPADHTGKRKRASFSTLKVEVTG
jgi:hypothetical protein